ncbi:MAG: hypothetical protein ACJ8CB_18475 [Ktedonobacteraceae bacterium]
MRDEQRLMQEDDEQVVSPSLRTQRILEHLEKQWQRPHEPSHDDFKRIIEFVLNLPEEYRSVGLTTIAEHFVNGMGLHLLAIMATFQQKAKQEDISLEEYQETFNDTLPKAFQTLAALSKRISIESLDELAALNNITIALYTLSRVDSAEEAQKWLYELPTTYYRKLLQANLLVDVHSHEKEVTSLPMASDSNFVDWGPSYQHNQSQVIQEIAGTNITVSTYTAPPPRPVPVSLEMNQTNFMDAA